MSLTLIELRPCRRAVLAWAIVRSSPTRIAAVVAVVGLAAGAAWLVRGLLDHPAASPGAAEVRQAMDDMDASRERLRAAEAAVAAAEAELAAVGAPPPISPSSAPVIDMPHPHCASPGRCTLARAEMQRLRDDRRSFARWVRPMPSVRDGQQIGLKLYFKPDSPAVELGLQIGDLAVALNDIRLDTKEGGLAAYDALLTADELRLELVREGQALQIVLTLE